MSNSVRVIACCCAVGLLSFWIGFLVSDAQGSGAGGWSSRGTDRVEIFDVDGKPRVLLGQLDTGDYGLQLLDGAGRTRVRVASSGDPGASDSGSSIHLCDGLGQPLLKLECKYGPPHGSNPSIGLFFGNGTPLMLLASDRSNGREGGRIAMFDEFGEESVALEATHVGFGPRLSLRSSAPAWETQHVVPLGAGWVSLGPPPYGRESTEEFPVLIAGAMGKRVLLAFHGTENPVLSILDELGKQVFFTNR